MLRLHFQVGPSRIQSQTFQLLVKPDCLRRPRSKLLLIPADLSAYRRSLFSNLKTIRASNLPTMANSSAEISTKRPSITHIIFDMDGLLLDTENFYSQVQEVILARFGKTFDWSLKAKMMGKKALESAKIFVEESGISDSLTPEQFLIEREDMLLELFPTCKLLPGVSRLITHLHTKGIPMSVATGSHKRHFELKTQKHGDIFSMMHHIVMGDDPEVKKGKPSPDIFLAAARRFEGGPVDPRKILVFEDAPAGVGAAKNAEMFCSKYYHVEAYKQTYVGYIKVMPPEDSWEKTTETEQVSAPTNNNIVGRRKMKRKECSDERDVSRGKGKNKCGACHVFGHTILKCPNKSEQTIKLLVPRKGNSSRAAGRGAGRGQEEELLEGLVLELIVELKLADWNQW